MTDGATESVAITLSEWLAANLDVHVSHHGVSILVYSADPALWKLFDYVVSSAVSGPNTYLVPRLPRSDRFGYGAYPGTSCGCPTDAGCTGHHS